MPQKRKTRNRLVQARTQLREAGLLKGPVKGSSNNKLRQALRGVYESLHSAGSKLKEEEAELRSRISGLYDDLQQVRRDLQEKLDCEIDPADQQALLKVGETQEAIKSLEAKVAEISEQLEAVTKACEAKVLEAKEAFADTALAKRVLETYQV